MDETPEAIPAQQNGWRPGTAASTPSSMEALLREAAVHLERVRPLAATAGAADLELAIVWLAKAGQCLQLLVDQAKADPGKYRKKMLTAPIRRNVESLQTSLEEIAMLVHHAGAVKLALAHILLSGQAGDATGSSYTAEGVSTPLPPWRRITAEG